MHSAAAPAAFHVLPEDIATYHSQGFIRLRNVFTAPEAGQYRTAVDGVFAGNGGHRGNSDMFKQVVNLWELHPGLRALTFHPKVLAIAKALAGGAPLRLWHDQVLMKPPGAKPTVPHQGQTNWSHTCSPQSNAMTFWIALNDAPAERGCMGFIPGSHRHWDLPRQQSLADPRGLYALRPEFEWEQVVTLPLRAGDLTVHHAYTAHSAGGNLSDQPRHGYIIDFMDADTTFRPIPHPLTDALGLHPGDRFDLPQFPLV